MEYNHKNFSVRLQFIYFFFKKKNPFSVIILSLLFPLLMNIFSRLWPMLSICPFTTYLTGLEQPFQGLFGILKKGAVSSTILVCPK